MQKLGICITHTASCVTEQHSWNPAASPTCSRSWWFLALQGSCTCLLWNLELAAEL